MGRPRELFNVRSSIRPFAERNGLVDGDRRVDIDAYVRRLEARTVSPNGVFGAKVLFDQLGLALRFSAGRELMRTARLIWLIRLDVVAQAVSTYLAEQLQAWSTEAEAQRAAEGLTRKDVAYDGEAIGGLVAYLGRQAGGWLEFFSVNRRPFLHVTYEELVRDPNAVCARICAYCGVETEFEFTLDRSRFVRQADRVNAEFRRRYAAASPLRLGSERA